jgi:sugar phosphate isomerase/epimerase
MLDFWLPFADRAADKDMTICLENLWEPDPADQAELIEAGNHSHLRASFDNGHALVFSRLSSASWVEKLAGKLAHCHLHDNFGEQDEHKPVGEGTEDWKALRSAIARSSPQVILVAESDNLSLNKTTIDRLRNL